MKVLRLLLCYALLFVAAQARDITTRKGQAYKDVTINRVEAAGISISHRDGVTFIDFNDLPPELRKEFGFDETAYAEGVAANREREALLAIQRRATRAERADLRA